MYDTQDDEAFTHPTLEYLQRVPRIVYEILPFSSPHGRMNHDLTLAAGQVLRPAMFTLPSPSPLPQLLQASRHYRCLYTARAQA